MSLFPEQAGIAISPGESFNVQNPIHLTDLNSKPPYKAHLPPAVASVPPDHIRGYVHNKKVNHYLVGSSLGEGSFAKVKEAFHMLVGEKVAMKVIDKKKALQDPYVAKNFRREAKLLQMVRHQNILQLLEVIETDSSFYLITELCSGGELMKYIYKKGQLEEPETRKFMRQIVSAVDHLHRAGIIHRDLKVENMLLDANMDIKIIDFGLSNEEYIQGDNGLTHCTTQCGSPAYAAPELLGHKSYGPQVDIWSIGVNMYAMLTGCLPYTVEPFNITALHAKMLENKMNPIPDHLSADCKDLLKYLLKSNPDERIKMDAIMRHSWMNEGHALPFGPARYPNKLDALDLNNDILKHMVHILKTKETEEELKQELVSNRATHPAAIYHLLSARLARYKKHFQNTRVRRKARVSQDQGYYEGEEDDSYSITSMPTRSRKPSRHSSRGNVQLRHNRPGAGKDRPISHPPVPLEEEAAAEDNEPKLPPRHFKRRQTMPEMMLKEELAKLAQRGDNNMGKRPLTRQNPLNPPIISAQKQKSDSPTGSHRFSAPTETTLAPLRTNLKRNHYSTPNALNMIRDDLSKKLPNQGGGGGGGGGGITQAWGSTPSSRNTSRNPSRQGSRQSSSYMRKATSNTAIHTRNASYDAADSATNDLEDLEFHDVKSSTLPRSSKKKTHILDIDNHSESMAESYLPSITEAPPTSHGTRKRHYSHLDVSPERRNGFSRSEKVVEFRTELSSEEVLAEIMRVAHNLKIKDFEKTGPFKVMWIWGGVKMSVGVYKENSFCKLSFQWIMGRDYISYKEKCDKFTKKLKL